MNNTFNGHRFGLLLKKQWMEYRQVYIASVLILAGCLCMFYAFTLTVERPSWRLTDGLNESSNQLSLLRFSAMEFRDTLFPVSGILFLTLISGHYFMRLGKAASAIQELTLPVSLVEKVLEGFLLPVCVIIGTFALVFFAVDGVFSAYLQHSYRAVDLDAMSRKLSGPYEPYGFKNYVEIVLVSPRWWITLISGFILSSLFLLGSVYFDRYAYIKTACAVVVWFGLITFLNQMNQNMTGRGRIWVADYAAEADLPARPSDILLVGVIVIPTVLIWFAIVARLKEEEV